MQAVTKAKPFGISRFITFSNKSSSPKKIPSQSITNIRYALIFPRVPIPMALSGNLKVRYLNRAAKKVPVMADNKNL